MDIKITATGSATGPISWDLDGKKPHQSSHEFKPKSGPHEVTFKLDDNSGRDLRFNCRHPFSDRKDLPGCPPGYSASDQIQVMSCSPKELTISNANSGAACTIQYKLNFIDKMQTTAEIDPEFKNGGGS